MLEENNLKREWRVGPKRFKYDEDFITESTSWGTYLAFKGSPFFYDILWDSLQNPHLFLKFIFFNQYEYCRERIDERTGKPFLSFFDKNQTPYWEEDGVEIFPERAGQSRRPAKNGVTYDYFIRFSHQDENNLLNALTPLIDHIQILEIFRHPENSKWSKSALEAEKYIIDFCDNDKDLEDSEFAIKVSNRLSNSKNLKIYIDEDKDKTYLELFKTREILKSSNVSDEKINQIFTLLQGIKSQVDTSNSDKDNNEVESLKLKNQSLQEEIDRLIIENEEIVSQISQKIAQAQSNSDQFLYLLKAFHPGVNFLSKKSFLEILESKNAEYAKNLIEQLKNIAAVKNDE